MFPLLTIPYTNTPGNYKLGDSRITANSEEVYLEHHGYVETSRKEMLVRKKIKLGIKFPFATSFINDLKRRFEIIRHYTKAATSGKSSLTYI